MEEVDQEKISILDAARAGVERLRKELWACPMDHAKITIFDNSPGPWISIYSPMNKSFNRRDPVVIPIIALGEPDALNAKEWLPYDGPLPESDEYRNRENDFNSRTLEEES